MGCSSPNCQGRVLPVELARLPGAALIVVAGGALGQVGEDLAQRGLAQPPDGLGGELQAAVGALEVALALKLAFNLAQRVHVVHGLPAQGAADRVLVDVVQAGAGVVLPQRVLELAEVGQLGQGRGGVAQAQRLLAGHPGPRPALGVQIRPPGPQGIGQPGHLGGQPRVLHGLGHQVGQLTALVLAERFEQPLRRLHPADQRVDQLLQVGRGIREHIPVLGHEVVEVLLLVLAPRVVLEHLGQRGHHVLDPLHGLLVGLVQALLHALELAVQDLLPQQVLELLERLPGRRRLPFVVRQLPDRARGVGRDRVQLGLAHPRGVAGVGEQLRPLLADRLVQHGPDLLEHAVQAAAVAHLALPLAHPAQHVVQAAVPGHALAQQVAQRRGRVGALQHRLAQRVDRAPDVVGRLQRIRPAGVGPVTITTHG